MKRVWLAVLILSACSVTAEETTYELSEGSISGPSTFVGDVDTSIQVVNNGEFGHTFVVTDSGGRVVSATDVLAPGTSIEIVLNLPRGQYLVSCRLITQSRDGSINDHFQLGMYKSIEVS